MKVRVVPYSEDWPRLYEEEAARIQAALGHVSVRIDHIGSTAIPGIPAKPILDFLLEVRNLSDLDALSSAMEGLGYEALGELGIRGRRYFRKNGEDGERTHHVHAFETGDPGLGRHLAFRDYMTAHPDEAKAYGELKRRLADAHPGDIEAYMDGKAPFIKEREARAIAWRSAQER